MKQTLSLVEEVEFDALFTFIYSKARAARRPTEMEDQVPMEEKKHARFDRLLAVQNRISERQHCAYVGTDGGGVLVDGPGRDPDYPAHRPHPGRPPGAA